MSAAIEELEAALGYRFQDRELLRRALTHKSRASDRDAPPELADNERLEFLGDAILGFLVSEWLLRREPQAPEGTLSKMKSRLVSATHLLSVAQALDVGRYLYLGRSEEMNGGRSKKALQADAVEAVIAAIYLDGGMEPARAFVSQWVTGEAEGLAGALPDATDYKSALQEMTQALRLPHPRYATVEERGPEHAKTFLVEVRVGKDWAGRAEGLSKKSAAQEAARRVIAQLNEQSP